MDLRAYYKKIRDLEQTLPDNSVLVVSQETPDGGLPGVRTEVSRLVAARMMVEGRVRLASEEEVREFEDQKAEASRVAEQVASANRVQLTVVPAAEYRSPKAAGRPAKE